MKVFYYLFWDAYRFLKVLLTSGKVKVSKEEAKRRMDICLGCPKIDMEGRFFGSPQPRCGICGCYLGLKTKLLAENCTDEENPLW